MKCGINLMGFQRFDAGTKPLSATFAKSCKLAYALRIRAILCDIFLSCVLIEFLKLATIRELTCTYK
jgi:hypothetical protein